MAEILKDATAIANGINEIIQTAQDRIAIVSPYIQIDDGSRLQNLLLRSKAKVTLVCRTDQEGDPISQYINWLSQLQNLAIYQKERLHTKCYVNEHSGIVTSQNLWQNTQLRNWELGVKLTQKKDPEAYADLCEEIRLLIKSSGEPVKLAVTPYQATAAPTSQPYSIPTRQSTPAQFPTYQPIRNNGSGHCISCHASIKLSPSSPYCPSCYAKFRNAGGDYQTRQRYCHQCGRPHEASLARPLCRSCYYKQTQA